MTLKKVEKQAVCCCVFSIDENLLVTYKWAQSCQNAGYCGASLNKQKLSDKIVLLPHLVEIITVSLKLAIS